MRKLVTSKAVYAADSIHAAVSAYSNLADIDVSFDGDRVVIEVSNCSYDESLTVREFENYLIGVENS